MTQENKPTKLATQPYRGTRDFYPMEMQKLNYIFGVWRAVAESFGYQEYLGPLLEEWQLYATKSGEELVNEQLYWFEDRGGRKLAIRPEMTPTVARMVATKMKELPKPIRWFSIANFMRYEKPQRGRVREFFQLNMDIFGASGIEADVEVIESAVKIMQVFGADERMYEIRVNDRRWMSFWVEQVLGYRGKGREIIQVIDRLDKVTPDETVKRLEGLGLTASQVDKVMGLNALSIEDVYEERERCEGAKFLVELFSTIKKRGIGEVVKFNATTVRGLDYYTGAVFEQFDLTPGNNRSMFGGGRYDGLVDVFGGEPIAAVGYAPGDVTTALFLDSWQLWPEFEPLVDVLVTVFNRELEHNSWVVARALREQGLRTELYLEPDDSISDQLNYAHRRLIPNVLIIGPEEAAAENVVWKRMDSGEQTILPLSEIGEAIVQHAH